MFGSSPVIHFFGETRIACAAFRLIGMKKVILSIALAVAAPFAWVQVSETTTTTTTTEGSGTITEFSPGSTIVLKESAGPKHYRFGKKVIYVTRSGKELDEATVRTKI